VSQTVESTQDELARRHRAAARVVVAVFLFTLALVALALAVAARLPVSFDPTIANALRLAVVFLGVGAVVFRRTRFSAMRLQDIAALRGASGLLETLQWTTVYVALTGGVVALLGFFISLMTGDWRDMGSMGVIAVAVLLYGYPRRAAWRSVVASAGEMGAGETGRAAKGTTA
jgi:hypothetical protein